MVNYFDNYSWQTDALLNFDATKAFGTRWTDSYYGMMTGSLERNLETLDWYKSIHYFDFFACVGIPQGRRRWYFLPTTLAKAELE